MELAHEDHVDWDTEEKEKETGDSKKDCGGSGGQEWAPSAKLLAGDCVLGEGRL